MAAKTSIRAAVRDAKREERQALLAHTRTAKDLHTGTSLAAVETFDSFVNFAHKLGVGADNALTSGTYGFNPLTRNRLGLEWMHRGSWLAGVAVDVVADDMTRNGVDFTTEMDPVNQEVIEAEASALGIWDSLNETIAWSRLYGGALAVMLIDGQDMKTPLKLDSVGPDQFKGLVTLDRWMVEPSLQDLVTDFGPFLGLPKYYTVQANAPSLRGQVIHYSRIAARLVGVRLPYQQAMTENLWGISVLERLYDRLVAFDSASTGAAQLVFKSYLRTLKIPGLREIVAAGGRPLEGVVAYTDMMRRFQGVEGVTLIDGEDEFDVQSSTAATGIDSIITQLAMQISGALQVPMTRLFGQAPGGLSTDDTSGMRNYYDSIRQQQRRNLSGVRTCYQLIAASKAIKLPENFGVDFASLVTPDESQKAEIAGKVTDSVTKALDANLISQQVGMKELRQASRTTGVFTNISAEDIEAADEDVAPPMSELDTQLQLMAADPKNTGGKEDGTGGKLPAEEDDGPKQTDKPVGGGKARRALLPD